jgi:hypothetical protein
MTREEAIKKLKEQQNEFNEHWIDYAGINEAYNMAIEALEQKPCDDCISRQEAINCATSNEFRYKIVEDIKTLPSVTPKPKIGYISIDDAMSVFDDFMCGEVDEDGTTTFLEMLKDKAESEENKT